MLLTVLEAISQIAVVAGVLVGITGLFLRRRDIFMPHLARRQLEHVERVRDLAEEVACESYQVFLLGESIGESKNSLAELKREEPETWDVFRSVQSKSLLLYRWSKNRNHYLWPGWVNQSLVTELGEVLDRVQPFTVIAFGRAAGEQKKFMNDLVNVVAQLDEALRLQSSRWFPKT